MKVQELLKQNPHATTEEVEAFAQRVGISEDWDIRESGYRYRFAGQAVKTQICLALISSLSFDKFTYMTEDLDDMQTIREPKDDGAPSRAAHALGAIERQPQPFRDQFLSELRPPDTGGPYLTRALRKYLPSLLLTDGVAVPDDPEEMRWRLFFAHSQDMIGFRADIFTGGPNEEDNPYSPEYLGLRDRWPDGKTMLEGLAAASAGTTASPLCVPLARDFSQTLSTL